MLSQEQQIFEQINKAKRILVTFSRTWNGDALGSALALYTLLKKMDKTVDIAADRMAENEAYTFLPGYNEITDQLGDVNKFVISLDTTNAQVDKIKYRSGENTLDFIIYPKQGNFTPDDVSCRTGEFTYDLIITLNTPDLESLGSLYDQNTEFFYHVPIINIDHHTHNEAYGQINYVELTAVATSEIVFNLITEYSRDLIDEDAATCLLTGIIAKTRSFKTQNITPQALAVSSQLISMGARREEIVNTLYRSRSLSVLKLWGRVLARLTSSLDNKLVWSVLSSADFAKTETDESGLPEVIDELIVNIPQAHVIVLFYEKEKTGENGQTYKQTRALIYTVKNINALDIAKQWEPGGTQNLARVTLGKPIQEAEKELIAHINDYLSKLLG